MVVVVNFISILLDKIKTSNSNIIFIRAH